MDTLMTDAYAQHEQQPEAQSQKCEQPPSPTTTIHDPKVQLPRTSKQFGTTPPDYAHGPRFEWQGGPLIGYKQHADILRTKLMEVLEDTERPGLRIRDVEAIEEETEHALQQHGKACPVDEDDGEFIEWMNEQDDLLVELEWAKRELQEFDEAVELRLSQFMEGEDDEDGQVGADEADRI